MKTINTWLIAVLLLTIIGFSTLPYICLGATDGRLIDYIESLEMFCQAMADTNLPPSLSVSAIRTIMRPERSVDEVRKQLEGNYKEMISAQGSNMVASVFPTLDDFISWYYREGKEADLAVRKLKDHVKICGDAVVFEQEPLNSKSEADDHVIYIRNIPSDPGTGQTFIEINNSREVCYLFDTNQWKLPPYSTFGTFTDRDRFLLHILLRSLDKDDAIAIAKLSNNTGGGMCQVAISESIREARPALEFKFAVFERSGPTNRPIAMSKWVVDKADMGVVYESAQYANGQLLDLSIAEDFQWNAAVRYPGKVTVCKITQGQSPQTIVYDILAVSTNDLSAEMTLYTLLRHYMGKVSAPGSSPSRGTGVSP